MAWDQDRERRTKFARELSRQDFWKAVYAAAISNGNSNLDAEVMANRALLDFDGQFEDVS